MYCIYCGNEMPDDAVMCVKCGRLTREYEEKLYGGQMQAPTRVSENVTLPASQSEEKDTDIVGSKSGFDIQPKVKLISWALAAFSVLCGFAALLTALLMPDTGYFVYVYPYGEGILEIIFALAGLLFGLISCTRATIEIRKIGLKSNHLFPSVIAMIFAVAMLVLAIVTLVLQSGIIE